MSKYNWNNNFRPDGKRGVCPRCNEHIDIGREQTLRSQLLLHYLDKHPNDAYKSIDYVDKLFAEIQEDLNHDNK